MHIFHRQQLQHHRNRAAKNFHYHDFLVQEAAENICSRLEDTTRTFPIALDLGCHTGQLAHRLQGRGGITTLIQSDISLNMVALTNGHKVVIDEELLPFRTESIDLVMSALSLHWVNDLPGTLVQIRQILKPHGLMMIALLGGRTLQELRQVMLEAAIRINHPISPFIMPCIDIKDAGGLLQRAGFAMPVADTDLLTTSYPSLFHLLNELRGMGETSILKERAPYGLTRKLLDEAALLYEEKFSLPEGGIQASFEIVTLTGIRP